MSSDQTNSGSDNPSMRPRPDTKSGDTACCIPAKPLFDSTAIAATAQT
ncbi:MAG: hypothetical protein KME14_11500 [Tildeniella torsiva UHER 1998/13D]|nr:hypothetical protein [Tildeniella torsiva UHER 1998/13D]